jgi:hypothetical protein
MENEYGADARDSQDASQLAARILREAVNNTLPSAGHKRSLSGSILSKLSFLRSSSEAKFANPHIGHTESAGGRQEIIGRENGLASVVQQQRTRTRKGSLRKTAILGTGRLKIEERDRENRSSGSIGSQQMRLDLSHGYSTTDILAQPTSPDSPDDFPTPRQLYEKGALPQAPMSNVFAHEFSQESDNGSDENLVLGGITRVPMLGDMSTTDEDEAMGYSRSAGMAPVHRKASAESYFPIEPSGSQRRRSTNKPRSPLASLPLEAVVNISEECDYSETEWWGWFILFLTWVVFVIGMGSCFGVWSWAWDVGETPYAPPELEDDPTLPVVGYYPALIILTAVMAWVWVVVAWVGMKYFKHAKISGEDV